MSSVSDLLNGSHLIHDSPNVHVLSGPLFNPSVNYSEPVDETFPSVGFLTLDSRYRQRLRDTWLPLDFWKIHWPDVRERERMTYLFWDSGRDGGEGRKSGQLFFLLVGWLLVCCRLRVRACTCVCVYVCRPSLSLLSPSLSLSEFVFCFRFLHSFDSV